MENTIYSCIFCTKIHKSKMSLSQHTRLCAKNPNRSIPVNNFKNKKSVSHICRFCNSGMNKKSLNKHEILCDKNPNLDFVKSYYASGKSHPNQFIKAKMLGEDIPSVSLKTKETLRKCNTGRRHTLDTKLKLSISRKKFLEENPDKHPWKNNLKFISVPCEHFKSRLKLNNIEFEEEYKVLHDRNFSIDIAFPSLKIGIEINGNQHYDNNGNLSNYYQKRHDIISNSGWTLCQVHYLKAYDDKFLQEIIDLIKKEAS